MGVLTRGKRAITAGAFTLLVALAILTADDELKETRNLMMYRRNLSDELDGSTAAMSAIEVIHTGVLVGTLYVLTGPNLAAIATLSGTDVIDRCDDGATKKNRRDGTFLLGVRWGIGNSGGLLLVGALLVHLQSMASTEWTLTDYIISYVLQTCVGVFSLLLGTYGLVKALKNREYSSRESDLEFVTRPDRTLRYSQSDLSVGVITEVAVNAGSRVEDNEEISVHSSNSLDDSRADSIVGQIVACLNVHKDCGGDDEVPEEDLGLNSFEEKMWRTAKVLRESMKLDDEWSLGSKSLDGSITTVRLGDKDAVDDKMVLTKQEDEKEPTAGAVKRKKEINIMPIKISSTSKSKVRFTYRCNGSSLGNCFVCTPGVLAVLIGILHRIAGPGGVLSSVDAFQLQHAPLAFLFLTVVMGGFSALYGRLCMCLAGDANVMDEDNALSKVFLVEFGSACVSIVVGIVWLTLLIVGQLDASLLMIGESTPQEKIVISA
jgi:hypothetical protein